jgi:hypothetical protein
MLDLIKPLLETKRNQIRELACIPMWALFVSICQKLASIVKTVLLNLRFETNEPLTKTKEFYSKFQSTLEQMCGVSPPI